MERFSKFEYLKSLAGSGLTPPEIGVLAMLLNYAWRDGTRAYPGEERLAADCGISARQVRRHLKSILAKGDFIREKSRGSRLGGASEYQFIPRVQTGQICPVEDDDYRTYMVTPPDIDGSQPDIEGQSTGHLGSLQPDISVRPTVDEQGIEQGIEQIKEQSSRIVEKLTGQPSERCWLCSANVAEFVVTDEGCEPKYLCDDCLGLCGISPPKTPGEEKVAT
jgi:hypothetical protein